MLGPGRAATTRGALTKFGAICETLLYPVMNPQAPTAIAKSGSRNLWHGRSSYRLARLAGRGLRQQAELLFQHDRTAEASAGGAATKLGRFTFSEFEVSGAQP